MDNQVIIPVKDFDPKQIFECGQCFRWNQTAENTYVGVAKGKALKVSMTDGCAKLENTTQREFDLLWKDYFDLQTDYGRIKEILSDGGVMKRAADYGSGIRILRQDPWETLVSFIISSNNNIPRIKKIIEIFCRMFGKPFHALGETFYTFPDASRLEHAEAGDLAPLNAGYRDRYILDAVDKINSGEINLTELARMEYRQAKDELMKMKGVGPKVADCVALFGLGKSEAFPVDVWVRRVLHMLYHKEYSPAQAAAFAESKFGKYAGVAQQYLFYYMRENAPAIESAG